MAIQAEGKFTTVDFWRGSRLLSRKSLAVVSICGLLILATATLTSLSDEQGWRGQLVVFGLGLLVLVYYWVAIFYRAHRRVTQSPNLRGTVRFEFDDSGFVIQSAHARSVCEWTGILKWREGEVMRDQELGVMRTMSCRTSKRRSG